MSAAPGFGAVVVGTGFGARVHIRALRAAGFAVHALVGRDLARTTRRAERLGVDPLVSVDQALALPGVDLVTVATPPHAHAPVVLAALAAGKHVVCEKPFAMDAEQAATMLEAAERAGVVHAVGHEFRFAEDRATVGWAIAEGRIGRPRLATLLQLLPLAADPEAPAPDWWFDPGRGGGWLGASGSHVVDQARAWLGEVASVSAQLPTVADRPQEAAEDSFALLLRMRSGAVASLVQSAAAWGEATGVNRVAGDQGTVWTEGGRVWVADRAGTAPLDTPAGLRLPDPPPVSDDPRERFSHLEVGPYTRLLERVRDAMAGDAPAEGLPTFADGLACQRVLDAARFSAAGGGALVSL